MPEAVKIKKKKKDMEQVNKVQENILKAYESDFFFHIQNSEANKISLIWNSIPSQLAKENKKFLYQTIKEGARAREYENALNWLNDANLIYKIYNVKAPLNSLKSLSPSTTILLSRFAILLSKPMSFIYILKELKSL